MGPLLLPSLCPGSSEVRELQETPTRPRCRREPHRHSESGCIRGMLRLARSPWATLLIQVHLSPSQTSSNPFLPTAWLVSPVAAQGIRPCMDDPAVPQYRISFEDGQERWELGSTVQQLRGSQRTGCAGKPPSMSSSIDEYYME
jgi:hypothetical protein